MKKKLIYFGLICFLLLLIDFYKISILLYFEKITFLNYIIIYKSWTYVLLFLILINTFYYKINNYKHQKLAIFFFIIIGIFSLLLGIFLKSEIKLIDFSIVFFRILACSIEAVIIILIKNIMEKKYYSPLKVCYLIGFINFIVMSLIFLFILLVIKDDLNFIFDLSLLKKFGVFGFIIYFLFFSLLEGIIKLLINIVLNKYTTLHLFMFFKLDSLIDSSIIIVDPESKKEEKYKYFIELFLQFIEFFMYSVYLEMIELSENIKKNIQNRAVDEYKDIDKEEKERNNLNVNFEFDGGYTSNFSDTNDFETDLNLKNSEK